MVVVQPDQYVAHILPFGGYTELAAFIHGVEHLSAYLPCSFDVNEFTLRI